MIGSILLGRALGLWLRRKLGSADHGEVDGLDGVDEGKALGLELGNKLGAVDGDAKGYDDGV